MTLPNELHPGFLASAGGSGDLGDPIEQSLRNDGTAQFYRSSFPIPSQWTASFWFKFGRGYRSTGGGGYAFSWHFSGTSYVICGLGIGHIHQATCAAFVQCQERDFRPVDLG